MVCENKSLKKIFLKILRKQSARDALLKKSLYSRPTGREEFVYKIKNENGDVLEIHDSCWINVGQENKN